MVNPAPDRPVRSFVRRDGRLTRGQKRALQELLPRYLVPQATHPLKPAELFGNNHPTILEIGFGNGELLSSQAIRYPDLNFIGFEVHRPGIGHLLLDIETRRLNNIKIATCDVMDYLPMFNAASLYAIWLFFPDPWRKKRHHKRRLINQFFLQQAQRLLTHDGVLHIATDWPDYAHWITQQIAAFGCLTRLKHYPPGPLHAWQRPRTKFERRGIQRGYPISEWLYRPY